MTFKLLQASESELISGGHRRPIRLTLSNTDYVDIDATNVRNSGNFVANRDDSFRNVGSIVIGDVFGGI